MSNKMKVMIAEDNKTLAEQIREQLDRSEEFEVCGIAGSGKEAEQMLLEGVVDILIIISQLVDTAGMWTHDLKIIRRCQLFAISPVWLVHNILVFSIGGILTETFTIISTLIAMYRYRNQTN